MSNEATAEPDQLPDPMVNPTDGVDGFRPIEPPNDMPASNGWRDVLVDRFGLAASVLVHLCLVLWAVGWLALDRKPAEEEAIPVMLVQEEEAKPPPPSPPQNPSPETSSKETSSKENSSGNSDASEVQKPRESAPSPQQEKPADPPSPSAPAGWSDVLASLGMAADSRPTTLSKEERDAVAAQAKPCWKIPAGWVEPRQVSVTIRFQLNPDGTLKGSPSVVAFPASELGKAAAVNAMRAVAECAPFKLPADKYDQWNDIQLRFEP